MEWHTLSFALFLPAFQSAPQHDWTPAATATCPAPGDEEAHADGRAVDINEVDGVPVGSDNEKAKKLQEAAREHPNIADNFGPFFQERRLEDGTVVSMPEFAHCYQDHIHLGGRY